MPGGAEGGSVDDQWEENAVCVPQRGQVPVHLVRRILAEIAIEDFGIIPDFLDDIVGPVVGQSETLAHARRDAEELGDLRRRRLRLYLVDVLGGDALLL